MESSGDVRGLYEAVDSIHGFGPALSAKVLLYIVRGFGIGLDKADAQELKTYANGLCGELWNNRRLKNLRGGISPQELMSGLTKLGDPFAIDLFYLLDEEIPSNKKLLKELLDME